MALNKDEFIQSLFNLTTDAGKKEADKKAFEHTEVAIERTGTKIILPGEPGPMSYDSAIEAIKRVKRDEETVFNLHETIEATPPDGLYAFIRAMKEIYGWASPKPAEGFFEHPPQMISLRIGPNIEDTIDVPFGKFLLPNVKNPIELGVHGHKNGAVICVSSQARKGDAHIIKELVLKAHEILKRDSIYRGKAITINTLPGNAIDWFSDIEFIDVRQNTELLFNEQIQSDIEVNIWAPIKNTEACRAARIPLKRGILLEGPYGVGKSLCARATAAKACEHGWTFINLAHVDNLAQALKLAERYAPAIVFAEDIDRVLSSRDDAANDIVNTLDGVVSKTSEIITVLTTNHVENISQVMLRPGRLDAIISLEAPDAVTAEKLIRLYARGLLKDGEDLSQVASKVAGMIPASIREMVERSKLNMIALGEKRITNVALLAAARSMVRHNELLNRKKPAISEAELFYENFKRMIGKGIVRYYNEENADAEQEKMRLLAAE